MPVKDETNGSSDASDAKPVLELNLKDLDGVNLGPESKMSAADIAAKVENKNGNGKKAKKPKKPQIKHNKDGSISVRSGNMEIGLPKNVSADIVAHTVEMVTEQEAEPKMAKEPKAPKEPRPPRARKFGRFPSASIKKMDVNELRGKLATLPQAEVRRMLYEFEDDHGKMQVAEAKDYIGIDMGGMIINVPSKDYEVVQFADAFRPVVEFLAENHDTSNICAALTNNKLQAHMYVAFPDKFNYVDPTGKKFELGMIVSAGHRDRAIRFDGFGFRGFCMNQYFLSQSLGHTAIVHRANAREKIQGYVDQLAFHIEDLDEHMKIARSIGLPADEVAAWVGENYIDRAVGPIIQRFNEDGEPNVLGLYNAITNVMSRSGEQGLIEADGLMDNLKWAEDLIRIDDGQQDVVKDEFREILQVVQARAVA